MNKTIINKAFSSVLKCGEFGKNHYNTKFNYKIEAIELDDIVHYHKEKYNSNNHWTDDIRPMDYDTVLAQTHTTKWINLFKQYKHICIHNPIWINSLKKIHKISSQTGKFSKLFEDEFDEMCTQLEKEFDLNKIFGKTGYFVRVNNVSLKCGQDKEGPYYSIKQILQSAVSCIETHTPIHSNSDKLDIYLMEWVDIKPEDEFRVFVFENKITAISQQNLYSLLLNTNPTVPNYIFEFEMKRKLNIIVEYFYNEIMNKINWINSYTIDIALVNSKPFFIELNSFGKEYAAGSALFHWILDKDILYNESDNQIVFRYTVSK